LMTKGNLIGVDLGGTNVRAGLIGEKGLIAQSACQVSSSGSEEQVLQEIRETVAEVFDDTVSGIGIGVPSVVDVDRGVVYTVENIPSWREVFLADIMEKWFKVPVQVNNDANCFALGEFYYGSGRGYRDLLGMVVGTGLGAGLVIDGRLYCGQNCGAGEVGSIPFQGETIEYYCSGQYFSREHGLDGAVLHERALGGDREAREIFSEFGAYFGQALMTVLYAYDPQIIVMGGSVSKAWPFYEPAARRVLESFSYQHALARVKIVVSTVTGVALLGAAALCLDAGKK